MEQQRSFSSANESMEMSEVSGFTTLTLETNETNTWHTDLSIPSNINGSLLFLEHYERWMSRINNLGRNDQVVASAALRNLREHAEQAMILIFASGCMVCRDDLSQIDPLSHEHVSKYLWGVSKIKFLSSLRKTKRKICYVLHLLETLSSSDGNPELGRLAIWTDYHSTSSHEGHTIGISSPVRILDDDHEFLEACMDILALRVHRANNPPLDQPPVSQSKQY